MRGPEDIRRWTCSFLCALVVVGCSSADVVDEPTSAPPAPGTQVGIPAPGDIDPGRLAPLAGLPPCDDPPVPPAELTNADLGPVPPGSVVLTVRNHGTLTSAQGYSERTPVEIMVAYLRLDGWEVLSAEDEVFESEVLLDDGQHRVFVKSHATCDRGSAWVMHVSADADQVPTPVGSP